MSRIQFQRKVLFFIFMFFGLIMGWGVVEGIAAASWPSKDITFIIPFRPGGGMDTQPRILAPFLEKALPNKVNIIMKNLTGAGGKIGALALMRSAPDGYTIGILPATAMAMMQINGELETFDIRKMGWLGELSFEEGVVVASTASGIKTAQDMKNREIRFAVLDDSMFQAAMLAKKLGMKPRMVMFEGGGDQYLAAMRGDVDVLIESVSATKRGVANSQGKLIPLFTVGDKRASGWPEVPSSKELGVDLGDLGVIAGTARSIAGPALMPADVLKILQDSVWKALQDPGFKANMEKAGFVYNPGNATQATKTLTTTMKVYEENKDVIESLKKK